MGNGKRKRRKEQWQIQDFSFGGWVGDHHSCKADKNAQEAKHFFVCFIRH